MLTSRHPQKFKLERRLNLGLENEAEGRGAVDRVSAEPIWTTIPEQVREAEALGYDMLLAVETPNDPFLAMTVASMTPGTIGLGTGIAIALSRSPVAMAYTAWDLQRMSGGRFMLGLGSQVKGHIVRRFSMPWSGPAERMKEYIEVVRACWKTWQTGAPFEYAGNVYQVSLMPPAAQLPPQAHPHIPIQLAAVGEHMLRTAGEVADGVRLHDFATRKYLDNIALPNLRAGFEKAQRSEEDWQRFEICGGGMIVTAKNNDELAKEVIDLRKRLAYYGSTPAYRVAMELEGWGEHADRLHQYSREQRWDEMLDVFTEEMAHTFAAIGTHETIVGQIKKRFDGVTGVQFSMPLRSDEDRGVLRELIKDLKS